MAQTETSIIDQSQLTAQDEQLNKAIQLSTDLQTIARDSVTTGTVLMTMPSQEREGIERFISTCRKQVEAQNMIRTRSIEARKAANANKPKRVRKAKTETVAAATATKSK